MPVQQPWILATSTAKSNSGGSGVFILVLLGVAGLYLFTRSQKAARRKATATQSTIEVGSRVITTSGMYGTVVAADETTYDLEVDDDVIITFVKAAITRLAPVDADEVVEDETGAHDGHDHDGHEHDGHEHAHGDHDHDELVPDPVSFEKSPREDPARSSSES